MVSTEGGKRSCYGVKDGGKIIIKTIVIVEDNDSYYKELVEFLIELLKEQNVDPSRVKIYRAKSVPEAETLLQEVHPCAVVVDYRLGKDFGTDLVAKVGPLLSKKCVPIIGTSASEEKIPALTQAGCTIGCTKVKLAYLLCDLVTNASPKVQLLN